ncbi:hypothetical protein H7U32_05015 [Bifidobacterium pullorum subsp. saeculare]|uniref:Uncharacterized protein n=1 Tax=Bifidobacterium pullorum subsp. saeculare TaxID=78257 RepID=A0A938WWS4_9BIFI|nr:hypothetical protein [Bifidobacterium pullorum]MBM6699684.1 hypothetical protein [Bifidobacterium pullorum subsp. saeculare]
MRDDAPAVPQQADGQPSASPDDPYGIPDIRPRGLAVPAVSVHRGVARRRMSDEHIARIKARHRRERLGVGIAIGVAAALVVGVALCIAWWMSFLL